MNQSQNKSLLIIDGYGFVFRAYHVQPPLTAPDGQPVGAIYGLTSMLLKLIGDFKPEHIVMVLDSKGKNFRHDIYKEYKAHRPPAPEDLISQLPIVRDVAKALNFCVLEKEGFEADDIIATLAIKTVQEGREAIIISADKDLLQLMNWKVKIYDPSKSKFISEEDVLAKFGVLPAKVREVQALMGDSSDNIPGVKGVGPKTAAELINSFGDLKGVYASIDKVKTPRLKELLRSHQEEAFISWQLVGLDTKVDINDDFATFAWVAPPARQISDFINKYSFKSLNKRIEHLFDLSLIPPEKGISTVAREDMSLPQNRQAQGNLENEEKSLNISVATIEILPDLIKKIESGGLIGVAFEEKESHLVISLSVVNQVYLLDYTNGENDATEDLFAYSQKKNLPQYHNNFIDKIFADPAIKKITYDFKKMYKYFKGKLNSFDDLSLMDYCLNAGKKNKSLEELIEETAFGQRTHSPTWPYISAYFIPCYYTLKARLFAEKTFHLYETVDLPLCRILHYMEEEGVKIDINYLQDLSKEFAQQIQILAKEIYKICDEEFNISSPKQLGEILFDKLKLPFSKISGKSKTYATGAEVLEKLSEEGHLIADLILKYRHLTKLKNTYTDTLPKQADKLTQRIHTTFLQTSTTTGRLSSHDPNVQNIPIRTLEGNSIRRGFIAAKGYKLISSDYSQIELRVLSHVANIPVLKEAFIKNSDIHAQTASQIFSVDLDKVTPELRQSAKAINFGIIYGISSFGLARNLNIPRKVAADYITKYFQEYPGIEKYMKETIEFARKNGYVENLLGRRCYVPMINQKNYSLKAFGERAAINAPMQSLTADIAKMAMITIEKKLHDSSLKTKMILQIHDELIFEAPLEEVDQATKLIKFAMENVITLGVPLKVDISSGDNWQEI